MKVVILFLAALALGNAVYIKSPQLNSNAIIRQFFEMIKYYIKNGYAEKDLPTMDPSKFDNKGFEFNIPILCLQAAFENGTITGLSYFELQETEFIKEDIAIYLRIIFPLITIHAERYAMEGIINEVLPMGGAGKLEIDIHHFTFSGKVYLKQSDNEKSILFKKVSDPSFKIEKIISRSEFDSNIDDIANEMIRDLLADYVTRFNQFIMKNYSEDFISLINSLLINFDSWRLLTPLL